MYATAFSAFVLLMGLLRRSFEYPEYGGLTTWQVVMFYYSAGAAGGALLGVLRPIEKYYAGKLLTAYLLVFLVYGGGTAVFLPLMNKGDPHPVPLRDLLTLWALMCLVLAPVYVRVVRKSEKPTK